MSELKDLILKKYGSQKKFAEVIGVSESTLCRYIADGSQWRGDYLIKAVNALKIPKKDIEFYFFKNDASNLKQ